MGSVGRQGGGRGEGTWKRQWSDDGVRLKEREHGKEKPSAEREEEEEEEEEGGGEGGGGGGEKKDSLTVWRKSKR